MKKKKINIHGIPAIIWGEKSEKVYIHVHGKMSCKEYAETFAKIASNKGYQTISFDLPEHGECKTEAARCDVWNGIKDLNTIADYVFDNWKIVSLFACSLGAYFSLQTYQARHFEKCLFQSPIVNMKFLVDNMMMWSHVTEEMLAEQGEIYTDIDNLRWDYYCYIKEHPVTKWNFKTSILYGVLDNLQSIECLSDFSKQFNASLTVAKESQHAFMEEKDFSIVDEWLKKEI